MVVTALDVKNLELDAESIGKALQAFRLCKEKVVLVGDSKVDLETTRSSRLKFVAHENREIACDGSIDRHPGLLIVISSDGSLK